MYVLKLLRFSLQTAPVPIPGAVSVPLLGLPELSDLYHR